MDTRFLELSYNVPWTRNEMTQKYNLHAKFKQLQSVSLLKYLQDIELKFLENYTQPFDFQ